MKDVCLMAFIATVVGAAGCSEGRGACTPNVVIGLNVVVGNSVDGAYICDAVVTAHDGSYSEQLTSSGCWYRGASEVAGTFTLVAEHAGFEPTTMSGVRVVSTSDGCHVRPVNVTIRMVPAQSSAVSGLSTSSGSRP
jgi:hypothetical protein